MVRVCGTRRFFSSIQLDTQGNVYVAGHNAGGGSFVPVNPLQPGLRAGGFVSKLDPTGSTLLFSSLVGATGVGVNGNSSLSGLAVDAAGNIYVAGNMIWRYTPDDTRRGAAFVPRRLRRLR